MPAETHQLGRDVDARAVQGLLLALLGEAAGPQTGLAELGVDADGLADLWEAVCEEFGERALGPELEPETLDPSMTVEAAAEAIAVVLTHEAT